MGLGKYALKRILLLIPVFLGVTAVVFLLLKLVPGDPVAVLLPPASRTPEQIASLRTRLGLNQPIYIQYAKWLWSALHGNLGTSYANQRAVTTILADAIWPTMQLTIVAFLVALFIAIPVGVASAVYKDTWIDNLGRVIAFTGISIPAFWLGIMVILLFALWIPDATGLPQLIPAGGYASPSEGIFVWLRHVIAPGAVLGLGFSALTTRLTRASMVEVLNEDYVRTARAKGVRENAVVMIHAFRNALIPVLTVMGLQLGFLLNGSIVVEQVFQWPGIGRLLFQAVLQRDFPLIQGIVLFIATIFVFANLFVDLMYAVLDPRIRYD
jgi:peptide/nickel transport system permease protein